MKPKRKPSACSWICSRATRCCCVDTYDVRNAVEKLIAMGRKPRGVRLDSGDLAADSIWTRKRFDDDGWGDVEIFASGDLDEDRIASLLAAGARIDTFGVGTSLSTSSDAPSLNVLYKLAEVERDGVIAEAAKLSAAKVTYPGRKQVYRAADPTGRYAGDVIALEDEPAAAGRTAAGAGHARRAASGSRCAAGGSAGALPRTDRAPAGGCGPWRPPRRRTRSATARGSKNCWRACANASRACRPA